MGFFDRWRFVAEQATVKAPRTSGARFDSVVLDDAAREIFGIGDAASWTGPVARISRAQAIQVPAVKRARDLVCGTIGTLPLNFLGPDFRVKPNPLLEQPEVGIPRSVTMTRTVEDLFFEGTAIWRIVESNAQGYPTKVRRLEPGTWDIRQESRVYVSRDGTNQGQTMDYVPDSELIRFYSPNDAILEAGARAIRTCLKLDAAAANYADDPMAQGYFRSVEGADPIVDEQGEDETDEEYAARRGNGIRALICDWKLARQTGGTGYVPAGLEYVPLQWDPAQLQLAEGRQHAVLEIARLTGINPEDLGVQQSTRTYLNGSQKQQETVDYTLSPYAVAVQDRLSMGDVTPRGSVARFDYSGFVKSDEMTRVQTYAAGVELGLYSLEDAQRREELPPHQAPAPVAVPAPLRSVPNPQEAPLTASGETFAADDRNAYQFDQDATLGFSVDEEARTIFGLVAPYGIGSSTKNGRRYSFSAGVFDIPQQVSRVKLLLQHDMASAVGKAVEFTEDDAGLWGRFKVARGADGDRALALAADGVFDGLSVGLTNEATFDTSTTPAKATRAPLAEVSLVPNPAFSDARVATVTASTDEGNVMTGTAEQDTKPPATVPVAFDSTQIAEAIAAGFAAQVPAEGRQIIPAVPGGTALTVKEPHPYRFEGEPGEFDFSADLVKAGINRDPAASERLDKFMALEFATATTDVNEANPTTYRPDMYVDNLDYETPIWDAIYKGSLSDITPFSYAAWASSSTVVSNHVEGTEPTVGTFVLTGDTVTPTALSGKFEINREVWDQVGNPQISSLIWAEIKRSYYEGLETAAVTYLDSLSPTGITITAGATDDALEASLTSQLAALNYIRGGYRFRDFFLQVDLYQALIGAVDDNGRKLFPVVGPSNATGTVSQFYGSVDIGGLAGKPAWALAATGSTPASSYLINRADVAGWATPPRRLDFDYQVKSLFVGVWGYKALKCTRLAGVREVIYDPVA